MASNDNVSKSGKGSDASRLSDSPLAIRRGNADPTDIDDTPLTLGFSERHDYENTLEPSPPIEEMGRSSDAAAGPRPSGTALAALGSVAPRDNRTDRLRAIHYLCHASSFAESNGGLPVVVVAQPVNPSVRQAV
jgi:hypothetical protein